MKLFVVVILFTLNYSFAQTEVADSSVIIVFNERIAQSIIDGDRNLDTSYYLTKDELRSMMETIPDSLGSDSIMQVELDEYQENLSVLSEHYSKHFTPGYLNLSRCGDIVWSDCTIDSSQYMFEILNPFGRDKRVFWPESKNYMLDNTALIFCKGHVFISEGEKKYLLVINALYFDGKLKFYYRARAPRIARLK